MEVLGGVSRYNRWKYIYLFLNNWIFTNKGKLVH